MRITILTALTLVALGCGASQPGLKEAPITITGKVSKSGQPVGNVAVALQPLDRGHSAVFPVKSDGTFQGELISGTYAYSLAQTGAHSAEMLRKVDPRYLQPDLQRTVEVRSGSELLIAVD